MSKKILLNMILFYQRWLSPLLGHHCRFHPSCSHYTHEAILRYGTVRGVMKGASRLLRCHPFSSGGFDPLTK